MKRLVLALFLALFPASALGQGYLFQTTITSARGTPMAGATITVCTSAGALVVTNTTLVAGCTPTTTIYTNAALTVAKSNPFQADGYGNASFYAAPGIYTYSTTGPTVTATLFNITLPVVDGSSPILGDVSATSYNNVVMADTQPGANAGAKISAAIAEVLSAQPITGGIVDARGFQGAQTISTNILAGISAPISILFGAAKFDVSVTQATTLDHPVRIVGDSADQQTIFEWTGAANGTVFDTSATNGFEFINVVINGGLGATAGIGWKAATNLANIFNDYARQLGVLNVNGTPGICIDGGASAGLADSTFDYVQVSYCGIGIRYGQPDNSFYSVHFNHNTIGLQVAGNSYGTFYTSLWTFNGTDINVAQNSSAAAFYNCWFENSQTQVLNFSVADTPVQPFIFIGNLIHTLGASTLMDFTNYTGNLIFTGNNLGSASTSSAVNLSSGTNATLFANQGFTYTGFTSIPTSRLNILGTDNSDFSARVENAGTGDTAIRLIRGGGTASNWYMFLPSGTTDLRLYNAQFGGVPMNLTNTGTLQIAGTLQNVAGTATMGMTLKKGTGAGDYTHSGDTNYADVDATNLGYTVTVPTGWKLSVRASGTITTATAVVACYVSLYDGATLAGTERVLVPPGIGAAGTENFSTDTIITGDGNSHTIKLQFKTSNAADAVTISNSTAGLAPAMVFTLMPSN